MSLHQHWSLVGNYVLWSSPSLGWNESSSTQSVVLVGKRVTIPSSGEYPEPFSETAFMGIGMRRGIQYAHWAHQSTSKDHGYSKQILFIGNSRRNTEICLRSSSVREADARCLLRHVSWDKEFTLSALGLRYLIPGNRAIQSKASLKGYDAFFRPDLPRGPSGHACLQHSWRYRLLSRPCSLARGYSLWYHTKWSPTVPVRCFHQNETCC